MTKEELLKVAKPILFNTAMVKAILEGRKTVTRRVINRDIVNRCDMEKDGTLLCFENAYGDHIRPEKLCRYQPGDILYVRETWHRYEKRVGKGESCHIATFYGYRASIANSEDAHEPWKPSIHMPKEATRIFLKVKDVRVERLQECGKGWCLDIEKEGVVTPQNPILYVSDDEYHDALREEFQKLWNSTIKIEDIDTYGWDANPYVWVIEFERIEVE